MPLIKRSYEKQSNMLDGKNFVRRNLYGEYIDKNPYGQGYDMEKASKGLSADGKRMITNFINKNIKREKELRKKKNYYMRKLLIIKLLKMKGLFGKMGFMLWNILDLL